MKRHLQLELKNSQVSQRGVIYTAGGGTGGLLVKTGAPNLELQCQGFFSFPLFNLSALGFTQLYPIK